MIKPLNPLTICEDGTRLSVQASADHYCLPKRDVGPYTHAEVAFIEDCFGTRVTPPACWREFVQGGSPFPGDQYNYVPVELIDAFVTEHGGIRGEG